MRMMTAGRENSLTSPGSLQTRSSFHLLTDLEEGVKKVHQTLLCSVTSCTQKWLPTHQPLPHIREKGEKEDHLLQAPAQLRKEALST